MKIFPSTPDEASDGVARGRKNRLLITCSFMLAACVCYLIGYTPGLNLFFLVGAIFETVFWIRLFRNYFYITLNKVIYPAINFELASFNILGDKIKAHYVFDLLVYI